MNFTAWIISLSAASLGIIMGVAGFFIKKWIQSVDETIKEHARDLKVVSKQIGSLESKQDSQTENIISAVHSKLSTFQFPHGKIDALEQEVSGLKKVTQEKLLPHLNLQAENLGRVILIERSLGEQNEKLIKLFEVVKRLVPQKPQSPK